MLKQEHFWLYSLPVIFVIKVAKKTKINIESHARKSYKNFMNLPCTRHVEVGHIS